MFKNLYCTVLFTIDIINMCVYCAHVLYNYPPNIFGVESLCICLRYVFRNIKEKKKTTARKIIGYLRTE